MSNEEREIARELYNPVSDEYLNTLSIPCGASTLELEDRVRVAEIIRHHGGDMKMVPLVLRIEFRGIYITPLGSKAYDFIGRTFFFLVFEKMRVGETGGCGRIISGWESFGEEIC